MNSKVFANAALVLLGHGATSNDESSASLYQHAAELRRRGCFPEVREAFWKQPPLILEVLPALAAEVVFLVPFFISEGYFSDKVIPHELGFRAEGQGSLSRVQRRGAQTWIYCNVVGTHPKMMEVLLARAREVTEQFPFPCAANPKETTLFIAGHGTEQNENSRAAIQHQVELLRARRVYAAVHGVFLEEEPRIARCYELAQTKNIVVVPFFTSEGLHVREDIPVLLGEPKRLVRQRLESARPTWRNPSEKHGKRVWYASSAGTEPLLAEVILERAQEAAAWL